MDLFSLGELDTVRINISAGVFIYCLLLFVDKNGFNMTIFLVILKDGQDNETTYCSIQYIQDIVHACLTHRDLKFQPWHP